MTGRIRNSVIFVLGEIVHNRKRVLFFCLLYETINAVLLYLFNLYTRYILDMLESDILLKELLITSIVTFGIIMSFHFAAKVLQNVKTPEIIKVTIGIRQRISEITLKKAYENIEDPNYINTREIADKSLNTINEGFQGVVHAMFGVWGCFVSVLMYLFCVGVQRWYLLAFVFGASFLGFLISKKMNALKYNKNKECTLWERKSKYYFNLLCDYHYGKDIRIFGLDRMIREKFREAKDSQVSIIKKFHVACRRILGTTAAYKIVTEGIILLFCVQGFMRGDITIGVFSLLYTSSRQLFNILDVFWKNISILDTQSYTIEDLKKFLQLPDMCASGSEEIREFQSIEIQNIWYRISFAQFCDKIIFLKNGEITEQGTHEELMQKKGEYRHFFELQSRYFADY